MNIAYKGNFLREGLLDNGHKVYDLDLKNAGSLGSALKALPAPADLVVWEFYGGFSELESFSRCEPPVAAYCVDTPLNEFWLTPCLKNVDYVFVDQPQCVSSLARNGIRASWLPLPARKSWFQPTRPRKHDITFVGTTSGFRQKRNNLLNLIQSRFKINIMSGLDIAETQKVFSESKIVLNENFFPGLTMRVLQGLSAGSIVFTEESPYGDDFSLKDQVDLVYYNPDNILERLSEVLDNYDKYASVDQTGQEKCRELYSCERVAAALLERINAEAKRDSNIDEDALIWNQTVSKLLYAQRFGGNFSDSIRRLKDIASSSSEKAAEARLLIGDIQARFKGVQSAIEYYEAAIDIFPGSLASLKLALLYVGANKPEAALKSISRWIGNAPRQFPGGISDILKNGKDINQNLLSAVGEIFFSLGRRWDMGFQKAFADPAPDTAFDIARAAWDLKPSARALDMMTRCLDPYHMRGELLPYMLAGINAGILSRKQILETASAAYNYYDRETAASIVSSMKNAH